jgi:hypothetical protein
MFFFGLNSLRMFFSSSFNCSIQYNQRKTDPTVSGQLIESLGIGIYQGDTASVEIQQHFAEYQASCWHRVVHTSSTFLGYLFFSQVVGTCQYLWYFRKGTLEQGAVAV